MPHTINTPNNNNNKIREEQKKVEEKRAVFISYIELANYLNGKNETVIKNTIDDMLDNIKDFGLNMVILQVRSFSDAIYPSSIFPSSKTVVSKEGDPLPFDLLEYFITESHRRDLSLHAWINPYRIRSNNDTSTIHDSNPAFLLLGTRAVIQTENGIYYNPSVRETEELILEGVSEILDNYDVDGIHYDDYFYPEGIEDEEEYLLAKASNENLTLEEFRLEKTSSLIKKTYQKVKKKDKNLLFGIHSISIVYGKSEAKRS